MIRQAIELHRRGDLDAAASQYREILESDPQQVDALHLLGIINYERGDLGEATRLVEKAVELAPEESTFQHSLGCIWRSRGDWEEARKCFSRAAELNPNSVEALTALGFCELRAERLDEAEKSLNLALLADEDAVEARVHMGNLMLEKERPDMAREYLSRAVALEPGNPLAQMSLGRALVAQENYGTAMQCFRNALSQEPNLRGVRADLARCCIALGQYAEAKEILQEALEKFPSDADAPYQMARLFERSGNKAAAVPYYERALELRPGWRDAMAGMAESTMAVGGYYAAEAALEGLLKETPDDPRWLLLYGKCLNRIGRIERAQEALERVADLSESLAPEAEALLAELQQAQGDYEGAASRVAKALALDPENVTGRLLRIAASIREGEESEAYRQAGDLANERSGDPETVIRAQRLQLIASDRLGWTDAAERHLDQLISLGGTRNVDFDGFFSELEGRLEAIRLDRSRSWPTGYSDKLRAPVFLTGHPGSGLTAVMALLSAHPDVTVVLDREEGVPARPDFLYRIRPMELNSLDESKIESERARYWQLLEGLLEHPNKNYPVDVLPLELAKPEVLRRIFPEARIIFVDRDTADATLQFFFDASRVAGLGPVQVAEFMDRMRTLHREAEAQLGLSYQWIDFDRLRREPEATMNPVLSSIGVPWNEGLSDVMERVLLDRYGLPAFVSAGRAAAYSNWLSGNGPHFSPDHLN